MNGVIFLLDVNLFDNYIYGQMFVLVHLTFWSSEKQQQQRQQTFNRYNAGILPFPNHFQKTKLTGSCRLNGRCTIYLEITLNTMYFEDNKLFGKMYS